MTTDNRTNEPTKEQVERAAVAMQAESSGFFSMEAWRHLARVALTAAVPDAANRELTEAIRFTVEYVGNDMLPAIEGWDWYDALVKYAPEVAQAFVDKPIHFPKPTDAALAVLERIRVAVSGHPECDRYEEGDVISCGWKSAYASVVAALDGAPEPEPVKTLFYAPNVRNGGHTGRPDGFTEKQWHQDATADTGVSHTLPGRLYIVQCEWCPKAFAAQSKAGAMAMFRRHEDEMSGRLPVEGESK